MVVRLRVSAWAGRPAAALKGQVGAEALSGLRAVGPGRRLRFGGLSADGTGTARRPESRRKQKLLRCE